MSMMVPDQRAPEQEGPDDRDQHAGCDLELWGAPAIRKCPADNCEPCEHQDQSKSNMGQGEDRCVGDALRHLSWLSEVVRHERRLTVSWHQRVNRAEQDSGSHCEKDGPLVSAGKITEAGSHPPIEPVLQINE